MWDRSERRRAAMQAILNQLKSQSPEQVKTRLDQVLSDPKPWF